MSGPAAIMVAGDKDLVTAEFCHEKKRLCDLTQGEVTDDPDGERLVPVRSF